MNLLTFFKPPISLSFVGEVASPINEVPLSAPIETENHVEFETPKMSTFGHCSPATARRLYDESNYARRSLVSPFRQRRDGEFLLNRSSPERHSLQGRCGSLNDIVGPFVYENLSFKTFFARYSSRKVSKESQYKPRILITEKKYIL